MLSSVNRQWYLDINNFARHTPWAHGFMAAYANYGGVALLAILLAVAWWRARSVRAAPGGWRARSVRTAQGAVAAVLWAALGALAAVAIAQPINHLVAEMRPFVTLHGVETLVPRAADYGFPSDHVTAAGAVMTGLWLVDRPMAWIATAAGLFLAFSRLYVGVHYPFDVLAGLALGAAVILVLRPIAMAILGWIIGLVDRTPLRPLVEADAWR